MWNMLVVMKTLKIKETLSKITLKLFNYLHIRRKGERGSTKAFPWETCATLASQVLHGKRTAFHVLSITKKGEKKLIREIRRKKV